MNAQVIDGNELQYGNVPWVIHSVDNTEIVDLLKKHNAPEGIIYTNDYSHWSDYLNPRKYVR